jgi:hypothetical protein
MTGSLQRHRRRPSCLRPVFTTEAEKQAARVVMEVIGKYEAKRDLVPTSSALLKPEVQKRDPRGGGRTTEAAAR